MPDAIRQLSRLSLSDNLVDADICDDDTTDSRGSSNISVKSTTSGFIWQNGRSYPPSRPTWCPNDLLSHDTMREIHHCMLHLDDGRLFYSPLSESDKHILDIGTGTGHWAMEVADRYTEWAVKGVDISPAFGEFAPPNCQLEVDDVTRDWVWAEKFELVHIRQLYGSLSPEESQTLYRSAYDHMAPGGWLEQLEFNIQPKSRNGSMPPGARLSTWGEMLHGVSQHANRPLDTVDTMEGYIRGAGFINISKKNYLVPIGQWDESSAKKEAGECNMKAWESGVEGYAMHFMTAHHSPEPWTAGEVERYAEEITSELAQPWELYQCATRIWAQKPN